MSTWTEKVVASLGIEIAQKRGTRAWALCPFHEDHSATNFFIRTAGKRAGQSHCFSCKGGGTLIDLVMHVRSCDYESAHAYVELLGKGYEPPRRHVRIVERPPRLSRSRFKMPSTVIFKPLEEWSSRAKKYALGRGITPEEVDRYKIGYAIDGPLSCRIVLPWIDAYGQFAGYSARTFVGEEPKYLTPDKRDNADLSTMFGEHTWSGLNEVIIVTEGALNVMAALRAVDDYRIDGGAMGGSDINGMHMIKLASFKKVIILTDSDPAGDKAAIDMEYALGRYVEHLPRVRLPDKQDALDVGRDYLRTKLVEALFNMGVAPVRLPAS